MTQSIYAASSIHSKSTLSRKYDVDTSAMFNMGEQFNGGNNEDQNSTMNQLFQSFSLDIGRFDFSQAWVNKIRLIIFPFFLLFTSIGVMLIETDEMDSISRSIYEILRNLLILTPKGTPYNVALSVNLSFLIVYIFLIFFLIHLVNLYRGGSCPTTLQVYLWAILSRILMPIFTSYISHIFSHSIYCLIIDKADSTIITSFVISIPLLLTQFIYIFFSCSVYNATPVIRHNDISQLWYSMSKMDWMLNFILFSQVFLQNIILLVPKPSCLIIYSSIIIFLTIGFSVYILQRLPYIYPQGNLSVLSAAFTGIFCSLVPLATYYVKNGAAIMLIPIVLLVIISIFVSRILVNIRIKHILKKFSLLQGDDNNATKSEVDPLAAALIQLSPTHAIEFCRLGLKNENDMSLYLRIGFLFNQNEVVNQNFIKWATDQNIKTDLVLSACQVSYALQNDVRTLNTLEQYCSKLGNAPYNYKSFVLLFNHLRQELLTQLNRPLLDAIGKCKKSDRVLQLQIAEFWGAVLKQNVESMISILPQISHEMMKTDILFQKLLRNYPRSPTVLRETVLVYHKSLGEHHKTVETQNKYNKMRSHNEANFSSSSSSQNSTSFSNVDNDFKERMEPWVSAQDVINSLSIPPLTWLGVLVIVSTLSFFIIPIIILSISLYNISEYNKTIEPIQSIGNILHALSRIPQLLRRKQLFKLGEIKPWFSETGPPLGTLLEIITEDAILPNIKKYSEIMKKGTQDYLLICSKKSAIYNSCRNDSHIMISGNSVSQTTVYNLLISFDSIIDDVTKNADTFDWIHANSSSQFLFVFQNIKEIYFSLSDILITLRSEIVSYENLFKKMTIISLLALWMFPILVILPLSIWVFHIILKDIIFTMKFFFQIPKSEISSLRWSSKSKRRKSSRGAQPTQVKNNMSENNTNYFNESPNEKAEEMADNLATVPRKTFGLSMDFIINLAFVTLFTAIMTSVGIFVFNRSMTEIVEMTNCYVDAIEIQSTAVASYIWNQEVFAQTPILHNITEIKLLSRLFFAQFTTMFDRFLYGGYQKLTPAILLGQDVIDTYIVSKKVINTNHYSIDPVFGVLHEVYFSMSCESQMRLLNELTLFILSTEPDAVVLSFQNDFVYHYEHLLLCHLDGYLTKGRTLFNQKTINLSETKVDQIILVFVLMFIILFLYISSVFIKSYLNLKHHILTPRSLMCLVNPESLLKSQTLVKWLSGNLLPTTHVFSVDTREHNPAVYSDFAVKFSKCGLIITNEVGRIEKINGAVCTLFKTSEADIIGVGILDFLAHKMVDKDKANIIERMEHQILKMRKGVSKTNRFSESSMILGANSQLVYLSITIVGYNEEGYDAIDEANHHAPPAHAFSVIVYDRTTEYFQEALVESEKRKSEKLIESLMPESIVKRLNDGETDISFEVQKATILFASVYKWNEFISKMSAVQVVTFLNKLFSAYDGELANFKTITKLKTIGHIYMTACGLFSDSSVNTAHIMINYALKMLEIVGKIADEMEIPIQITIGVNTGGPVNCGILGHTRPAFDIIGDSVNVASRMNSSGVPNFIQISESTYEDIKFLKYHIRERGEIQVKGKGLKKTYLVSF